MCKSVCSPMLSTDVAYSFGYHPVVAGISNDLGKLGEGIVGAVRRTTKNIGKFLMKGFEKSRILDFFHFAEREIIEVKNVSYLGGKDIIRQLGEWT